MQSNTARLRKKGNKTKRKVFAYYLRELKRLRDLFFLFETIVQVHLAKYRGRGFPAPTLTLRTEMTRTPT
jgi:hypothetical protein